MAAPAPTATSTSRISRRRGRSRAPAYWMRCAGGPLHVRRGRAVRDRRTGARAAASGAAAFEQRLVGAAFHDAPAVQDEDLGGVLDRGEAVRDSTHGAAARRRSIASCTRRSDSVSSALVASSRMRMGGSTSSARAIAMRWRWPPERRAPRSPSTVARGSSVMKACAFAARAAGLRSGRRCTSRCGRRRCCRARYR